MAVLKIFKKLSAACLHFQNLWHRLYFYALLGSYIISLRIRKERKVLLSLLSTSLKSSLYFCRKLYFSCTSLSTWLGDFFEIIQNVFTLLVSNLFFDSFTNTSNQLVAVQFQYHFGSKFVAFFCAVNKLPYYLDHKKVLYKFLRF